MSAGWDGIAADIFVDILLRIPPRPRQRLRLVCRHWRDVIDERTREPRACAKLLVFYNKRSRYSGAYVFDDLTRGLGRKLNLQGSGVGERMIGTCNGLLCLLCLQEREIAVINPSIRGESIAVDLPPTEFYRDESSYSFGYHPATGQYKIVHVPCSRMHGSELDGVHVLTLGGGPSAWREVPAPAGWSSCLRRLGLASIDGVTYWATDRIMSFDLEDERVAMPADVPRLPVLALPHRSSELWQLTDVSGRLGLVVCYLPDELKRSSKTEVWVLEGGGEVERRWVNRYTVLAHGAFPRQQIALPHVAHGGYVLTTSMPSEFGDSKEKTTLEAHRPREERKMRPCGGMVLVGAPRPETTIGLYNCSCWRYLRTFAYVETREPLLVYCDRQTTENDT